MPVWAQDPQGPSPAVMHVENAPISQSVLRDPGLPGEDTWLAAASKTHRHRCSSGTNCNLHSAASDGEAGRGQRPGKDTKHGCSSQQGSVGSSVSNTPRASTPVGLAVPPPPTPRLWIATPWSGQSSCTGGQSCLLSALTSTWKPSPRLCPTHRIHHLLAVLSGFSLLLGGSRR